MAWVDLRTGKIFGCKEGSKTWFHEQAHLDFTNSEFGTRVQYYHSFSIMLVVIFTPFAFFLDVLFLKLLTILCSLAVLLTYLLEEYLCEMSARKKILHK